MGNYFIAGIAGFIGSALARALIKAGHDVVGFDNLSTGLLGNVPPEVLFFEGDGYNPELYRKILPRHKFDAIFHLAEQSSVETSFADPVLDLRSNTESTLHLLRYAVDTDTCRFIYASSKAVYGQKPDIPVSEDEFARPESFYGVSKMVGEHYLRLYEQFGVRWTALRLFNVYGPGQNVRNMNHGMVNIFMYMMIRDNHIHVQGSPNRYRDFVYVDDVVAAFLACLDNPLSEGRVFNIGGTGKVLVGDLVEKIAALPFNPPTVEYSGTTVGNLLGIHADILQAARLLGYEPEVFLGEGLDRMYAWMVRKFAA